MHRTAVTHLTLAITLLAGVAPLAAETTALSRILLPKDSEVIGTYDAQSQLLTCYTPHGRIIGHMDPQAITEIKPLSSAESADSLAQMQKQVDAMVAESSARAEAAPPLLKTTPRATVPVETDQAQQPAKPARQPRRRQPRTLGQPGGQPFQQRQQEQEQEQQPQPTMQNLNQNPPGFTVVPAQSPPPASP